MRISGFMVPAEKVVTVSPNDTIRTVMDLMLAHDVGAVVVIEHHETGEEAKEDEKSEEAMLPMPAGIITKSDILKAYHDSVGIDEACLKIMSKRDLLTCTPNEDRDRAARILEKNHNHHLIVVDDEHAHFVGIVSSWDIAAECAKDDRSWPYIRSEDGKIPYPPKVEKRTIDLPPSYDPQKPTTIVNHKHDFTSYMDDLDLEGLQ